MIPRIRTVKPQLFKHEILYEAEIASQLPLRLAFIALFGYCDREGRFYWRPKRLKVEMMPYDAVDMTAILDALAKYGFIKKYQYQGEWYGCIPSWLRHQHINQREASSDIPGLLEETSLGKQNDRDVSIKKHHSPKNTKHNKKLTNNLITNTKSEDGSNSLARACLCVTQSCTCGREGKGREQEEEGKEINVTSSVRTIVQSAATWEVFSHWKVVMNHPQAKLDPKREMLIRKVLKFGYSVEELCQAITGCSLTPHNIGHNDRGQRYDGLHVILRDSDQIDRFRHNYHYPPRILSEAERKTEANVQSLQNWVNQKMQEGVVHGTT